MLCGRRQTAPKPKTADLSEEKGEPMPLRDHFRPPIANRHSWEGFYGMWPATIVQRLDEVLPAAFTAEPRVDLGPYFEIDNCAYEEDYPNRAGTASADNSGSVATAAWAPQPTLTLDTELTEQYQYEVKVYDQSRGRVLVAAVEIVSPANEDRRESRRAFVTKCAALLQQNVCVSMIDLVSTRSFNLYTDLLALLDLSDPAFMPNPPPIYAVTCRGRKTSHGGCLEAWAHPLTIGRSLPALPLWLSDELAVSLELESSYEETCRALRMA